MRKAVVITAIVLLFLVASLAQEVIVKANIYPPQTFQVHSPRSAPYVYLKPNVEISFDYLLPKHLPQVHSFSYSLDGNANCTLTSWGTKSEDKYVNYTVFETLENLVNGYHRLTVYAYLYDDTVKQIIEREFAVDTTIKPQIPSMISPLNHTTYKSNQVPLIYNINSKVNYSYYSLDAYSHGFKGNITLSNLSEGSHKLRLIVVPEFQNFTYDGYVQTIYFNVDTNIEAYYAFLLIAIMIAFTLGAVYLRKLH